MHEAAEKAAERLIEKAGASGEHDAAMKYAQAALSVMHALSVYESVMRDKSSR